MRTVEKHERKHRAGTDKLRVRALDLTTERTLGNRGPWRAVWSVRVTGLECEPGADQGDAWAANSCDPYVTVVDAVTGRIVD
ncbi:hypothetical protein [Streptomyces sp. NPDC007905]|uniref:hypothetical protein n=1 Tax=Streptomyces sp. NPDC007905 TaxID=3364788 RepID=UPI0036E939C2